MHKSVQKKFIASFFSSLVALSGATTAFAQSPPADAPPADSAVPPGGTNPTDPVVAADATADNSIGDTAVPVAATRPEPPAPQPAPEPAAPAPNPLSITGYVQGELHLQDPFNGEDNADGAANRDLFQIRRGRVKIMYTYRLAELMVELDITNRGVGMKGAEVTLVLPWTDDVRSRLSVGLFEIPFGVDNLYSSSRRYFPEYSLLVRRFFPGERDLGAQLQGELMDSHLRYQLAILNGNPLSDALFPSSDGNGWKDIAGRIGGVAGLLAFGVSGYYGRGYIDGFTDDPTTTTVNESTAHFEFTRYALGVDARLTTPIDGLGMLDIYGEFAYAQNMDRASRGSYPQPVVGMMGGVGNTVQDAHQLAWYVAATQNLSDLVGVGVRAEQFDPNTSTDGNTITGFTLAGLLFPTENTRLTLSYFVSKQVPDEAWLRLQVKF